jgi:type II secretion system protein C
LLGYGLRACQIALALSALYLIYSAVFPFIPEREVTAVPASEVQIQPRNSIALAAYAPIGERNLFQSLTTAVVAETPQEEELEESKLQLKLLGTIAGTLATFSVATLEDEQTRKHLHVLVGDQIGDSADIQVARIEPGLIVINNKGRLEALTMAEEETETKPAAPSTRQRSLDRSASGRRRATASRAQAGRDRLLDRVRNLSGSARRPVQTKRGRNTPELEPELEEMVKYSGPAARKLLDQVRLAPSFTEDGELDGITVTEVRPGTPLAAAGVKAGDTIVSVNRVTVSGPRDLPSLLTALSEDGENCLETVGANGTRETRCWKN